MPLIAATLMLMRDKASLLMLPLMPLIMLTLFAPFTLRVAMPMMRAMPPAMLMCHYYAIALPCDVITLTL